MGEVLNIRGGPSTRHPVLGVLQPGENVTILDSQPGQFVDGSATWHRTDQGWVAGAWIRVGAATAETGDRQPGPDTPTPQDREPKDREPQDNLAGRKLPADQQSDGPDRDESSGFGDVPGITNRPDVDGEWAEPESVWTASPNHESRDGIDIDVIVLHHTGTLSDEVGIQTLQTGNSGGPVSSHYVLGREGTLFQLVDLALGAWHAGDGHFEPGDQLNKRSIGIEMTNDGVAPYTDGQYETLIELVGWLQQEYSIPDTNVVGHLDVAPATKVDPSENFDWERLWKGLREGPQAARRDGTGEPTKLSGTQPGDRDSTGQTDHGTPGPAKTGTVATVGEVLRIRREPSTTADIVGSLQPGASVTIEGTVEGEPVNGNRTWYQISQGFVAGAWVTLDGEPATEPVRQDPRQRGEDTQPAKDTDEDGARHDESKLGGLSARYESTGDAATVSSGAGDAGGVSYGTYQFSSVMGSAQWFVDSPQCAAFADLFAGLTPGTAAFSDAWRAAAARDYEGFSATQHDFILEHFFRPAARRAKSLGIDLANRSFALNDVIWSTAVQHGPNNDILDQVAARRDPATMSDQELIRAIYAERGETNADGTLVEFGGNSWEVQQSVLNRFRQEQADALEMLAAE